jgi:hypothetical protein
MDICIHRNRSIHYNNLAGCNAVVSEHNQAISQHSENTRHAHQAHQQPASLPAVTAIVNNRDTAVPPSLSVRVALHVLLLNASAAGVNVRRPAGLSCGAALNIALLLHTKLKAAV